MEQNNLQISNFEFIKLYCLCMFLLELEILRSNFNEKGN